MTPNRLIVERFLADALVEIDRWPRKEAIPAATRFVEALLDEVRAQLPEGMKHCTIQFKQCPLGHGWLTATNWVPFDCPTCERDALRLALQKYAKEHLGSCKIGMVHQGPDDVCTCGLSEALEL